MRTRILAAGALLALAACMGSADMGPIWSSVTVTPAPNALGVARGDTIRMWYDMPVDSASCATRFTLHLGDSLGPAVPGQMRFGDGYRQMMFIPDSLLTPGTPYFAHMREGMMTQEGWEGSMGGGGMMSGSGMMGQRTMMVGDMPAGAVRMGDGMGWSFTTGT